MRTIRFSFIFTAFLLFMGVMYGQPHPCIYVTNVQKEAFLKRMNSSPRVARMIEEMKKRTDPYVIRHQNDPEWIVSRLQLYWKNKYTKIYLNGMYYSHGEGNAPVPTVKISGSRDWATDYATPALEDIQPYMDDDRGMYLQNKKKEGSPWEWAPIAKTGAIIENINVRIMSLAQDAAFLYWLTGDATYEKFARDIFLKYTEGMYYREPPQTVENHSNQNLLGLSAFEVIHDGIIVPLTITYDFLYSSLINNNKDLSMIQAVFKKWADQEIKNGVADNNWNIMQARFITYLALDLDDNAAYADKKGKQYYIDQILNQNSIRQKALRDVMKTFDQNTGIWPESPGYSMGVSHDLLNIICLLDHSENNNLLKQYPVLEKAIPATFQYLLPNGYAVSFGDSKYKTVYTESLELLLSYYRKYGNREMEQLYSNELQQMSDRKLYNRERISSLFQLFFFEEDLSKPAVPIRNKFITNTFYAPNVNWFIQRNGMDPENGMAVSQTGTSGNHSHAAGIAMELFAKGLPIAPEGAAGSSYWTDDHKEYYGQFPAHNTVVVDGKSSYKPGKMDSGTKFSLDACYPESGDTSSRTGDVTFSRVSFTEPGTNSNQQRLLSIIRTGKTTGYFVDIFHSRKKEGNDLKHEYIYHNLGQSVTLKSTSGEILNLAPTGELSGKAGDLKGYDYFRDKKSVSFDQDFNALFSISSKNYPTVLVNFWMKGYPDRELFSVMAPKSNATIDGSVPADLTGKPLPTLVVRQKGEAWTRPFVSVIEAYRESGKSSIKSIETMESPSKEFTGIRVNSNGNRTDCIFSDTNDKELIVFGDASFQGHFAVITTNNGVPAALFLGQGRMVATGSYKIENENGSDPVNLIIQKKNLILDSRDSILLTLPFSGKSEELKVTSGSEIKTYKSKSGRNKLNSLIFELPACKNAILELISYR